jgi:hypothetical protein
MCAAPTGLASFFMLTQRFRAGLPLYRACGAGLLFVRRSSRGWQWPPCSRELPDACDASHSRDSSTRPYSQGRSALGQDDNNVCRPYGACLVLYAYPALPRWATLVSRLRRWFIVCAEKQSRNGSGRRVRENSPMHVMRVILGILPLGFFHSALLPRSLGSRSG